MTEHPPDREAMPVQQSTISPSKGRVCVAGAGGFIGGHLAHRLKQDGYEVVAADWTQPKYWQAFDICHTFERADLRLLEECKRVTRGCTTVYNLAADTGGVGFIPSNQAVMMYNNTLISSNMLEAARFNGVTRFLYASSEYVAQATQATSPEQDKAWPAEARGAHGLEKALLRGYVQGLPARLRNKGADRPPSQRIRSSQHLVWRSRDGHCGHMS